mmetsp:Transcript_33147/g.94226  ORF Transcript_33147/g.94226 Transcript_33147/m.94226 type:complete len:93 (+) Transcript_33147:119-397(+)
MSRAVDYGSMSMDELRRVRDSRKALVAQLERELHDLKQPSALQHRVEALETALRLSQFHAAERTGAGMHIAWAAGPHHAIAEERLPVGMLND